MNSFDPDQLVSRLSDGGGAPPDSIEAIQRFGILALVGGEAATVAQISERSGLTTDEVRSGIEGLRRAGRIETAGDRVVGVGGITLTESVHALRLPEASVHTWCALDAIGIPVALGLDAEIHTTCPHCGDRLRVTVSDESINDGPYRLLCPTGQCDDVRAEFCSAANLFCSTDHLRAWAANNPTVEGEELDLGAAAELGRAMWGRYRIGTDTGRRSPQS